MKRWSWRTTLCAVALSGAAMVGAGRASAQECESDDDCGDGLICKSFGTTDCARPAIDCEGADCPEPEPCEPMELKACALPPCESDDDCPSGTVCHSETYQRCSGASGGAEPDPGCAEGEECVAPDEPVCDTPECKEAMAAEECEEVTSDPVCTPVYVLPCSEDADCGGGFTCEEIISEWCSGSAGTPGDDPAPEPAEPECGSEPTGEFRCELIVTECSSDDDCESGWTCESNPERPACGGTDRPASGSGDSGGSGDFAPPADGEDPPTDSTDCGFESTEPEKVCMPPYHAVDVGIGRGAAEDGGSATSGQDSGGAEPPTDPADEDNGETGDDDESEGADSSEDDGGCSVSTGRSESSWLQLLGLFGAAALLRRRARKGLS